LIQIENGNTVKVVYTFIHPKYADKQYLYFSTNKLRMIEWLSHNRVLLYEKVFIGKDDDDPKVDRVKWRLIRRMNNFKTDYGFPFSLNFVSPDFSVFVSHDNNRKDFCVRSMRDEEILYRIPSWIMSFKRKPNEMMDRFMWISNTMIKVLNTEGYEMLLDLSEAEKGEFNQVNFNVI
jgi:hypothetical protein